ncbi:MAG TPA: diacylglycerol kinase family protein [Streptosporangiaceae bacterium]|nr:diacylglycerol kinase family protein [Streptosporangiaceae bacterium]
MTRTCCLVVNPAAGGGRAERLLPVVSRMLNVAGIQHEVCRCTSLEHARELAAAAIGRGQVAVAVGGDGLAGALAATVAGADGVFGIIPAGRGNDFARTLGIPFTPGAAARVIAAGQERPVDLIAVGRADFATPAGAGPLALATGEVVVAGSVYLGIPAVAAEIAAHSRVPPGELAYPAAAVRAVAGWRTATFHLDLDGGPAGDLAAGPAAQQTMAEPAGAPAREFAGGAVVVANSRYFGAGMMVAPSADASDGLLDVVYVQGSSKLAMIHALTKIKKGTHVSMRPVGTARARQVTITVGRAMPGGADGEPLRCASPLAAGSPLRIRALPGVLRMIT